MEKRRVEIEAIYTIKTDDNVLIHIRNVGLVYTPDEIRELIKKGEKIDFGDTYFQAAPKFEAHDESKYDWMNNAIFLPVPEKATGTAIIVCPGGGFSALSWDTEGPNVAKKLAEKGIVAFVLKYRIAYLGRIILQFS